MGFIKQIRDKFDNRIYPITRTKAVYGEDNNRLDNTLSELSNNLTTAQSDINTLNNSLANLNSSLTSTKQDVTALNNSLAENVNSLNESMKSRVSKTIVNIKPNETIILNGERIGGCYIIFSKGHQQLALGAIVGVGYGEGANRHKIHVLIESDITYRPLNGEYGLEVTNNTTDNVELTIMK